MGLIPEQEIWWDTNTGFWDSFCDFGEWTVFPVCRNTNKKEVDGVLSDKMVTNAVGKYCKETGSKYLWHCRLYFLS